MDVPHFFNEYKKQLLFLITYFVGVFVLFIKTKQVTIINTPPEQYLGPLYPILLKSILLLVFLLFLYNLKFISHSFRDVKKTAWVMLLVLFVLALTFRLFVVPHTHYIFFDEFEHINIAENILYSNQYCECDFGSNKDCLSCSARQWPAGYHTFLSLSFGLFGDFEQVAFNTNAVVGSITVVIVFFLLFLLFKNTSLSLFGAFVFAFIPVHLKYSGSAATEICSLFFVLLTMLFLELYFATKKQPMFLLFLATLLYAVNIRIENILLIFLFYFYILLKKGNKMYFLKRKYLFPIFVFLVLLIPCFQLMSYSFEVGEGYNDSLATRVKYLNNNYLPNILFFFNSGINSIVFSILCVLGAREVYSKKRTFFYYFLFFALFFIVYSSHYAGNINHFGDTVRYSLLLYVPLLIFSVYGVKDILKKTEIKNKNILLLVISVMYLVSLIPTQGFIFSKSPLNEEYEFVRSMKPIVPPDVFVLSYNPQIIMTTIHKHAINPKMFVDSTHLLRTESNIILFKDAWWYEKINHTAGLEDVLKKHYSFELMATSEHNYAFYNLTFNG